MTNQRKNMLIALAVLVIIAGAIGFDQANKSAIVEGQASDSALVDPDSALEMSSEDHDELMLSDSDLSAEELALWEECEAQYGESSSEELEAAANDPCAAFEDDFDEFGYHDEYEEGDFDEFGHSDEFGESDFGGEFAEAGFFEDDFDGYEGGHRGGEDGDYGFDLAYLLLEAVVIGLVVAGVVIWFQRRENQPAKK
jgi:hypothetical protein